VEDDRSAGLGWFEGGDDFSLDAHEVATDDSHAVADGEEGVAHRANVGDDCENGVLWGNIFGHGAYYLPISCRFLTWSDMAGRVGFRRRVWREWPSRGRETAIPGRRR